MIRLRIPDGLRLTLRLSGVRRLLSVRRRTRWRMARSHHVRRRPLVPSSGSSRRWRRNLTALRSTGCRLLLRLNRRHLSVVLLQLPLVLDELPLILAFELFFACSISRVLLQRLSGGCGTLRHGNGRCVTCGGVGRGRVLPAVGVHGRLSVLRWLRCSVAVRLLLIWRLLLIVRCCAKEGE